MNLAPNPFFVVVQMVPFVVLIFALSALVFNPLLDYLEERHRRIKGAQSAKSLGAESDRRMREIETQIASARAEVAEVRSKIIQEAQAEEQRIVTDARSRAEAQVEQFRKELAATQERAASDLRGEVEVLSTDIASRVLGRPVA